MRKAGGKWEKMCFTHKNICTWFVGPHDDTENEKLMVRIVADQINRGIVKVPKDLKERVADALLQYKLEQGEQGL